METTQTNQEQLKRNEKSKYTLATEKYIESFFKHKSAGLLSIIKDEAVIDKEFIQKPKIEKSDLSGFYQRNNDLIEKKAMFANLKESSVIQEKKINPKSLLFNPKSEEFYKQQENFEYERNKRLQDQQNHKYKVELANCTFTPEIDKNSKKIFHKMFDEEKQSNKKKLNSSMNVNTLNQLYKGKHKDVFNRLFSYSKSKIKQVILDKGHEEVYHKVNYKTKTSLNNTRHSINIKKISKTVSNTPVKYIQSSIVLTTRVSSNSLQKKSAMNYNSQLIILKSLLAEFQETIIKLKISIEDELNNETIYDILIELGFITGRDENLLYEILSSIKTVHSPIDDKVKITIHSILSFILLISGFYYSGINYANLQLINIKSLMPKNNAFCFEIAKLDMLNLSKIDEINKVKNKFSLLSLNRINKLNSSIKQKSQIKVINIKKELDNFSFSPSLNKNKMKIGRNYRSKEINILTNSNNTSPLNRLSIGEYASIQMKRKNMNIVKHAKISNEKEMKECTFKPVINPKSPEKQKLFSK